MSWVKHFRPSLLQNILQEFKSQLSSFLHCLNTIGREYCCCDEHLHSTQGTDQRLRVGLLCCGHVVYFVPVIHLHFSSGQLTLWQCGSVAHLQCCSVAHLRCGGIGDWRKWLKFTVHWQEGAPGPRATRSAPYKP